jgi:uncharacterized protein (TIGR00369 family)
MVEPRAVSDPKAPTRPTVEQLARYAELFNASQTMQHFGVKIRFPDAETVEAVLDPIQPQQRGGLGSDAVNGGVLAALFDLCIGCAPATIDPTRRTATVQLSMNFMRGVRGDTLLARGKVDRAGGTLLFCSAQIFDGKGQLCSTCTGMVRMSELKWQGGESPAIN